MADIKVDTRYRLTLDLSRDEAEELYNSIHEAMGSIPYGNWRSDPTVLKLLWSNLSGR